MKIGYARVSTEEQNLDLQLDELKAAGCKKIFQDEGISGITIDRDGLSQAISAIGEGDSLVVWKLDRLGRSLPFLCDLIERLGNQGVGFHSVTDGIDTNTSGGTIGRPPALFSGQIQHMHELLNQGETQGAVAELFGVSANTIGRAVRLKVREQ